MTPAEKLGYKVGDEFEYTGGIGGVFKKGAKIRLTEDDGSIIPRFDVVDGSVSWDGDSWSFANIGDVKPLSKITLQPGDYITTADLSEDDYHKVAKAFMAAGAYPLEYSEDGSLNDEWEYFGWSYDNDLEFWDNTNSFAAETRQLTLSQILNATNAGGYATQSTTETKPMHLTDQLEAAIRAQSEANAEVERLRAEWRAAYPSISGCVDIDVEDIKPEDWKAGDIVECIDDAPMYCTKGNRYVLDNEPLSRLGRVRIISDDDGDNGSPPLSSFRFIRRP